MDYMHPSSMKVRALPARHRGTHHPGARGGVCLRVLWLAAVLAAWVAGGEAFAVNPTLLDPTLQVAPVVTGLTQPTCMAFLGPNDFFINEKSTGRVKRVVNGSVAAVVLDLPVNSNSERGLLGIALHPLFPANPSVYLYWTESSTGADSGVVAEVGNPNSAFQPGTPQPLGNRVDRFVWNPVAQTLTYAQNLIRLHAFQNDFNNAASPNTPTPQGNHNSGQIRFGPDGKIYIQIGDNGRRGWLQNLPNGPFLPPAPDDQFGGPAPDNNHVTGCIFRLNDDGTTPVDNPFFAAGAAFGGEVGANIQKIYSYGHRNGFGLAFDPFTGNFWENENGDDAFDEINKIVAGGNYGWIQAGGPISRVLQFKTIELNLFNPANAVVGINQQVRYPMTRVAYSPMLAFSRLFALPGSTYQDPEFSWRYAVPPSGLGFVNGNGLGPAYNGTMWSGEARTTTITGVPTSISSTGTLVGGFLIRFKLTSDRAHLDLSDNPNLADRVADNGIAYPPPVGLANTTNFKFDARESETLLMGQNFGVTTDIQTGPDGALYTVSNTDGAVYRISAKP
jgi:glucose/arabinose dehydrogenase